VHTSPDRGGTRTHIPDSSVATETENARGRERDNQRTAQERERGNQDTTEKKGKRERENEKEESPTAGARRVREHREEGGEREGGTRVDRVAKTTGSQVIIKCNQYFTYFSREVEGRFPRPLDPVQVLSIPFLLRSRRHLICAGK